MGNLWGTAPIAPIRGKPLRVVEQTTKQAYLGPIPRNGRCPCGSGRKFKRCCWLELHPCAPLPEPFAEPAVGVYDLVSGEFHFRHQIYYDETPSVPETSIREDDIDVDQRLL